MVKALIGMLILLFPLTVLYVIRMMSGEEFTFHSLRDGTAIVASHLAVILGWYKLKCLAFPDSQRCSVCGRDIPLTGRQRCRSCGFRWEGHYFDKCPNCEGVASIIHCPHCELSSKRQWWYEYWHRLN